MERDSRATTADWGGCALLPGEQGQWAAMAMGYDVDTPYLLLWAAIMGLEGTSFSDQRKLLTCLGWIVPYRYKAGHKVVKPLVSNRTPPFPS